MATTEEEQVQAMLEAMGASSIEEIISPELLIEPAPPAEENSSPAPEAAAPERIEPPEARVRPHVRDLSISTLMHVLGLPSAQHLDLVEAKIDSLTRKLSAMSTKIECMSKQLENERSEATLERIDFQLNSIRTMLRTLHPELGKLQEPPVNRKPATAASAKPQARILSSEGELVAVPEVKPVVASEVEPVVASEVEPVPAPEAGLADAEFQQQEAKRVRVKTGS